MKQSENHSHTPVLNKNILIVEDSKTQARILKDLLEANSFFCEIAIDGHMCLEMIDPTKHDLILLDVMLPDYQGTELLKRLKSDRLIQPIPVIMLTSLSEKANVAMALSEGASDYITKPYYDDELIMRIKLHLDIRADKLNIIKLNESLHLQTKQLDWIVKQKSHELRIYHEAINKNIISIMTDKKGTILKVNDPILTISGYDAAELLGKNLKKLLCRQNKDGFFRELISQLENNNNWHGELKSTAKSGKAYWLDTTMVPIYSKKGNVDYFLVLALPITERKEAEEKRGNTLKMLESMAFRASHDVRGPLTRIQGLVYLLEEGLVDMKEISKVTRSIKDSTNELDMATSDLTKFINRHYHSFDNDEETMLKLSEDLAPKESVLKAH